MNVDKCKQKVASMPLEQRLYRWKRKQGSPFKEKHQRPVWRESGRPSYKEIAEVKVHDIRSETREVIEEAIHLAKIGEMGKAILIPSLEAIQEDFTGLSLADSISRLQAKRMVRARKRDSGLDALDFKLSANYVHGPELFAERSDVVLQPKTIGIKEDKQALSKKVTYADPARSLGDGTFAEFDDDDFQIRSLQFTTEGKCRFSLRSVPERHHPIQYGGLTDKVHPSSIKSGLSSHHMPQTRNCFSRKVNGAFFSV